MSGGKHLGMGTTASFVLALEEESSYLNAVLEKKCTPEPSEYEFKSRIWKLNSDPTKRISVATIGRMGNVRSSGMTAAMWRLHSSPLMILIGIAGILDKDRYRLGDVILSADVKTRYPNKIKELRATEDVVVDLKKAPREPTVVYHRRSDGLTEVDARETFFENGYLRHIRDCASCGRGMTQIRDYLRTGSNAASINRKLKNDGSIPDIWSKEGGRAPGIFSDTIFSWGMVVDSEMYRDFLLGKSTNYCLEYYPDKSDNKPVASVDMESFGFFALFDELDKFNVPTPTRVTIRGLSDHAGLKKEVEAKTGNRWRRLALENAGIAAIDFVEKA